MVVKSHPKWSGKSLVQSINDRMKESKSSGQCIFVMFFKNEVSPLQTRLKNFCSNAGIETIVFVLER
jgi:hypothetical protein